MLASRRFDIRIAVLVVRAAAGGFCGDNISYWLGGRYGGRVAGRLLCGERGQRSQAWAHRTGYVSVLANPGAMHAGHRVIACGLLLRPMMRSVTSDSPSGFAEEGERPRLCQVMMQNVQRTAASASSGGLLLIVLTGVAGLAGLAAHLLSGLGLCSPERGRE